MAGFDPSLSSRELLDELLPKLQATEQFLSETLGAKLEYSLDPRETRRLQELKDEFELEITMINMNLGHLLRRYSDQLVDAMEEPEGKDDTRLELDEHEAVAVERIRRLYQRAQELQTDPA
ncbi:hypothetical protein HOP62_01835 [Halomonas sp. MCCC 1A17488]|uniref:Uncharacterized protein n=1 Tax=Billgrantia sulfidoxydans TaxID=2733484 RepID=A0ABX7W5G0_9GAMM|nr:MULTISPECIES: hypothetical protein [Halomonas]MCE8014812.1 hypothetical protein [Halomonas sp. MCCC 1A17488]MCG3238145.1 hypothetical protein [Halomonas sp. MCCC 1A17488]QPP48087.1 hypothetical protein I4484_12565 [Halomonas sp. SS10-MC5]QTP55370.1 hypothetical protein HNO51_12155 [Halomonas sulfidoxydans]